MISFESERGLAAVILAVVYLLSENLLDFLGANVDLLLFFGLLLFHLRSRLFDSLLLLGLFVDLLGRDFLL